MNWKMCQKKVSLNLRTALDYFEDNPGVWINYYLRKSNFLIWSFPHLLRKQLYKNETLSIIWIKMKDWWYFIFIFKISKTKNDVFVKKLIFFNLHLNINSVRKKPSSEAQFSNN